MWIGKNQFWLAARKKRKISKTKLKGVTKKKNTASLVNRKTRDLGICPVIFSKKREQIKTRLFYTGKLDLSKRKIQKFW